MNRKDESGVSPLYLAVFTGHPEVVRFLLDSGAEPDFSNPEQPLLHCCAERGFLEIA